MLKSFTEEKEKNLLNSLINSENFSSTYGSFLETIKKSIENIDVNIRWKQINKLKIINWLTNNLNI